MKSGFIALIGVLALFSAILAGCGSGASSFKGTNISSSSTSDKWEISATTLNGHFTRTIKFEADNLAALRAKSDGGGSVTLTLSQGGVSKTFDISGAFDAHIDAGEFKPGEIKARLDFRKASDVNVVINW